jgi:hypothetical protein
MSKTKKISNKTPINHSVLKRIFWDITNGNQSLTQNFMHHFKEGCIKFYVDEKTGMLLSIEQTFKGRLYEIKFLTLQKLKKILRII